MPTHDVLTSGKMHAQPPHFPCQPPHSTLLTSHRPYASPCLDVRRGIRHSCSWAPDAASTYMGSPDNPELLYDAAFREGLACLAPRGLTFETWLFHLQLPALADLASVSGACRSLMPSILTEIYLCHACSCQEIEDGNWPTWRRRSLLS
jgi:hypothetical protein